AQRNGGPHRTAVTTRTRRKAADYGAPPPAIADRPRLQRMSLIHAFAEQTANLTLRQEDETRCRYQASRRVSLQISDVVQQLPVTVARIQSQQSARKLGSSFDAGLVAAADGHRRERKTERFLVQDLGEIPTPIVDGIERFLVATVDLCGQE